MPATKRKAAGRIALLGLPALALLLLAGVRWSDAPVSAGAPSAPPPNFKVAFIGDQGINSSAEAVLQLILAEDTDMVLHLGDFGYDNETDPQTAIDWDAQITAELGADFPYFGVIGNHDVITWDTYQQLLEDRLALIPGASCTGDYGNMSVCTYQGLYFILSGIGTMPNAQDDATHLAYLSSELAADTSLWRICGWHKNQTAMQVGTKSNEVGWVAYETCRQEGAIIATAHEHSYHRTRTLSDFPNQTVDGAWPDRHVVGVGGGSSLAFVSGLGGQSIRSQSRCLPTTPPYGCNGEWATINSSSQGADFGALFIEFHVDGVPGKARGYFKDIDGDVADTFTLLINGPPQPDPVDSDGDGCSDAREGGVNLMQGGLRNYQNPWDFYDAAGPPAPVGDGTPDQVVDLQNDILGVLLRWSGNPLLPYSAAYDRGPALGPYAWNKSSPDGVIDLQNDILGVVLQFGHDCR
ncbi:MAG: flexitail domain-containing putative surface protein [Dehalococcoidia bacterium]